MAYRNTYSQNGVFMVKQSPVSAHSKSGWTLYIFDCGEYKGILKLVGEFPSNTQWACISSLGDRFAWISQGHLVLAELDKECLAKAYRDVCGHHFAFIPSIDITQKAVLTSPIPNGVDAGPTIEFVCSFNCNESMILGIGNHEAFVWDLAKNTTRGGFLLEEETNAMGNITLLPNPTQEKVFMIKVPRPEYVTTVINVYADAESIRVMSVYSGTTGGWTHAGDAFFYVGGESLYRMVIDTAFPQELYPDHFASCLRNQQVLIPNLPIHNQACHMITEDVALVQILAPDYLDGPLRRIMVHYNFNTEKILRCRDIPEDPNPKYFPYLIRHEDLLHATRNPEHSKPISISNISILSRDIPGDVLWHVFARLDLATLVKVSSVCSTWRRVATDDSLWVGLLTQEQPCGKMLSLLKAVRYRSIPWFKFHLQRTRNMKGTFTLTDRKAFLTCSLPQFDLQ